MAQNSTRIWETPSDTTSSPARHSQPAQLPSIATLTKDITPAGPTGPASPPYAAPNRSSDPWSQPQSTRSSAYSSGLNNYSYSSGVTSPHRASNSSQLGSTSHPYEPHTAPTSAGAQPSPGFASPHNSLGLRSPHDSAGLPNLNQQYQQQDHKQYQQQDHNQYRNSDGFAPQESRRSSLGSQVNTGFSNMHLNGAVTSPYANGNNQSQSSIAASLQRERGIPQPNGVRNSGLSATSSHVSQQPMSPLAPYPGESRQAFTTRTAPIISNNPMKEIYNAEKPTAGQPYAFPDPDMSGGSSAGSLHERNGSTMLSRRNSDHTSITSSIVTNDSKLPKGQHRLDEDPMPGGTHHHSLQSKHVSSIAGESDSPDAASPYSRTPALRASHKMAERKRRTEMKFLFEQLRNQIPANHGSKSSKWEILSKASEHINLLEKSLQQNKDAQQQLANASAQMDAVRLEIESLRNENHHLYQEMQHYREQARPQTATAMHPQTGYAPPPPQGGAPMMIDQSRSLPPLTNGVAAGGGSMQGVQYTEERR